MRTTSRHLLLALGALCILALHAVPARAQIVFSASFAPTIQPVFLPSFGSPVLLYSPSSYVNYSSYYTVNPYLNHGPYLSSGRFLNYGPYMGSGVSSIQPYSPGYVGEPIGGVGVFNYPSNFGYNYNYNYNPPIFFSPVPAMGRPGALINTNTYFARPAQMYRR